jgi:hypothetical protein
MQISNGILSLDFDDHSGRLVSLKDAQSGEEHLPDAAQATLFRLLVPSEIWQSRFIEASQQPCRLSLRSHQLTLTYDQLRTAPCDPHLGGVEWESETLPIRVVVTVDLPAGSPEAFFVMQVENQSTAPISEVWFPRIAGWTGYAGQGQDKVMAGYQLWDKPLDPYASNYGMEWGTFFRWQKRWAVRYPTFSQLPWLDISGGGRGLSLINYMRPVKVGGMAVENVRGYEAGMSLAFGWFANPEIKPGQVYTSPRFGLSLHSGDWHATARRYRDWLNTWWQPAQAPQRLPSMLGVQNVVFTSFDGTPVHRLSEIPAIAQAGIKYGIYDLCVWDYLMLGTYGRVNPAGIADFPSSQEGELRRALADTRQMGVSTSMLINHRLVSPTNTAYRAQWERGIMRMRDGSLRTEPCPTSGYSAEILPHWMGPQSQVMCPRSTEFRQSMQATLDRLLDIGFDAFFIDQPFEVLPCYAPDHGHASPDDTHAAVAEWVGAFRKRLRARFPQGYIIGEMADVAVGEEIELWWNWYWFNTRTEVMAYGMPPILNSYVTDVNFDRAQQGFLHGFLLMLTTHGLESTLDNVPQFGDYVRRLAALRARTYQFTVSSQFSDVDGLTADGGQAKLFLPVRTGVRPAITLINPTDRPSFAKIQLDGTQIPGWEGRFMPGKVYRMDGSTQAGGRVTGDQATLEIPLPPREVAVWEL